METYLRPILTKRGSVNDEISRQLCSLSYLAVDDVAEVALQLGRGAKLAKLDIAKAYRIVPIHPDDRYLLGMKWQGQIYLDSALPFGLRSAPKVFNAVADGLEWVIRSRGVRFVAHYLDDFVVIGKPHSDECEAALGTALSTCDNLGCPTAPEKQEGPTTCINFLGIIIDTMAQELCLPVEKLERLQALIVKWRPRKSCQKRELLSLIGQLHHACKVVRPGRRFLRRMISLSTIAKELHHHIRLNSSFRSDLAWWYTFLESWNGVSILQVLHRQSPDTALWSDASGSWGCAAVWGPAWFQYQWNERVKGSSIAVMEFLPIIMAAVVWGEYWKGLTIQCNCDNQSVVCVINSGSSKDPVLMQLLRCLFFVEAKFDCQVVARHTPGSENGLADALSRNRLSAFFSSHSQANSHPTRIPDNLVNGLLSPHLDWTSENWTNWFGSIFKRR